MTLANDIWNIKIDPIQLEQVLTNLIVNARDAITGIGKITLYVYNSTNSTPATNHEENIQAGDYVVMEISDTGHGMDEQTKQKYSSLFSLPRNSAKVPGSAFRPVSVSFIRIMALLRSTRHREKEQFLPSISHVIKNNLLTHNISQRKSWPP